MKVKIRLDEGASMPFKKTEDAEGYDIKAISNPKIVGSIFKDGIYKSIDYIEYQTGIYLEPDAKHYSTILPRSSISGKSWLMLANSEGLIDTDYRGQLLVRFRYLYQPSDFYVFGSQTYITVNQSKIFNKGDDIAQIVFHKRVLPIVLEEVETLTETERNDGAFGSTDVKYV